jgi:hypothetical protein
MTPHEAIAECRRAYPIEGARWPFPLISFLDDPPSEHRVFDWLTMCVGDMLHHLGASTEELEVALSFARRCAREGIASEAIEQKAQELWVRRAEDLAWTAVAQLLFALLAHRERRKWYRGSCAVPLCILDRLATPQGGLLERVVSNFSDYVGVE